MSDASELEQGTPAQIIFFQKLYTMIDNESHTGCIEWIPDGTSFTICSKKEFCSEVLPRYFGCKFTSFTRRLKRWGFSSVGGSYHNDHFYRDMAFESDDYQALSHNAVARVAPKKWKIWTSPPPSSPGEHRLSQQHNSSTADVTAMTELMRTINRLKREEKKEEEREASPPPSKRARASMLEQSMEAARTLASLNRPTGSTRPRQDDLDHLADFGHLAADTRHQRYHVEGLAVNTHPQQDDFDRATANPRPQGNFGRRAACTQPRQDYLDRLAVKARRDLDRLAANTRRQQDYLNRLAASFGLMEDVDLSLPYRGYSSQGRGNMNPQSKVRQMERTIPIHWSDDAVKFHLSFFPDLGGKSGEDRNSFHGLCQLTSDSRTPNHQKMTPAFNEVDKGLLDR